ncbi:MAG: 2OG-Fe(II) oxygenase [Cytophagales bacterium]|nr:2OG-Fe(II) oxygenase [Cytophagales bacterium]
MQFINPSLLLPDSIKALSHSYIHAQPYPHVVIDNFLTSDMATRLHDNFPTYDIFNKKYQGYNEYKAEGSNFEDFHPAFTELKNMVSSPQFCQWISQITQIESLFVTNDALGTGLHQGKKGSFLDIHIDFSMHHLQNVYRRLNLLIFFNPGWQEEWQGHTELWNHDMTQCVQKVLPSFNRALLFQTTGKSYHGYGKISPPEHITRKSFYSYFYTTTHGDQNSTYNDTIFTARPEESKAKKFTTKVKEAAKNFVKKTLKKSNIKF